MPTTFPFNSEVCGEVKEVLFHDIVPAGVGSASVTEYGKGVCVGIVPLQIFLPNLSDVVAEELGGVVACSDGEVTGFGFNVEDSVWDNMVLGKVVVGTLWLSVADDLAVTLEVSDRLLLFGVNANYRNTLAGTFVHKHADFPELGIPVFRLTNREGLGKGSFAKTLGANHLLDNVTAHIDPSVTEFPDYLRDVDVKPDHVLILRKSHHVFLLNLPEHCHELWLFGKFLLGAAARSAHLAISWRKAILIFRNCLVKGVLACVEKVTHCMDSSPDTPDRKCCEKVSLLVLIERVVVLSVHFCELDWGFFSQSL